MSYRLTGTKIMLISSLLMYKTGNGLEDLEEKPIDYGKLMLNKQALLGSRWAIEHLQKITVYHAVQIVDLVKVDVNDMSVRIDFHVKQRWVADGLDFPKGLFKESDSPDIFLSAEESVLRSVWSPDSFIPNARETKILSIQSAQSAVNIFKNKTIIYKARMYAVLGCSFTFQWYPLDIQTCDLTFESYKHASHQVIYKWEADNPVTAMGVILLYQYDFELPPKISTGFEKRWAGKQEYPYVKMTFKFERKLGNNIIQIFIPTILVVILSFFSFWLGLDAVPGRISLLVTCILTLVTMHSGLKGVVPPVHYIKMMDIWMIGCMVFVFGAICEFIVVKYLKWRILQKETAKEEHEKYLKSVGMHQSFHPPPRPPNIHYGDGDNKMLNMQNVVYPELGKQTYTRHNPNLTNSAQKRQAWHNAQVQAFNIHSECPVFDVPQHEAPPGYPVFVNSSQMPVYHQELMLSQPPPSRPTWVKIERVCRILFPLLFVSFNAAFWPILLIGAAGQHNDT